MSVKVGERYTRNEPEQDDPWNLIEIVGVQELADGLSEFNCRAVGELPVVGASEDSILANFTLESPAPAKVEPQIGVDSLAGWVS